MLSRTVPYLTGILALAAAYFAAAKVGLHIGFVEQVTAVWPPTGIALAAVLIFGRRAWPGVALGAFLANATANEPRAVAGCIAAGNTLEALAGAWLVRWAVGFQTPLVRVRDVLALIGLGALLSPVIAATVGVASLCLGGVQPWAAYGSLWGVWWLGDAVGGLVVAPLLLTWTGLRPAPLSPHRAAEAAALFAGLTGTCLVVFAGWLPGLDPRSPLQFTIFPFIIWAAVRFGPPATTLVTALASAVAVWGTLNGLGPFARGNDRESLILLQAFMGVVAVTALVLAAATAERRLADAALRRGHTLLRAVAEGTTDAVFVKDARGRYLMINDAGASLMGRSVGEVVGRDDSELFSPETAAPIMEADRRVLASGRTETTEEVGTAAGVTRTYLTAKGPYRDEEGRVVGVIGIARDITDRKRLEEELRRRAAELAETDKRKDEFLAMLAHELRNPLAPIVHGLHLAREAGAETDARALALEAIDRQVHHLARLVDDLLDVSRIARGKMQIRPERLDLTRLVRTAAEDRRAGLAHADLDLAVEVPAAPVWVTGDATRLGQVLGNLLDNAAKFTDRGGQVAVRLSVDQGAQQAVLVVRDTGVGIGPEVLPKLFTAFAQADRSLERARGGLGLGLAVVRALVELHGGEVTVASGGLGKGTEFSVRLPLATGPPAAPAAVVEAPAAVRRRVLVVEDNADAAETLRLVLELQGHEVHVAHTGPDGVDAAAAVRPEVVVCDIGLPGFDGFEVARRLREQPGGDGMLLVALTGYGQEQDRRRAREAGFHHHLVKPVEPDALCRVLASQLAAGR
jgi:PAS domain S-box-containing protein